MWNIKYTFDQCCLYQDTLKAFFAMESLFAIIVYNASKMS